MVTRGQSASNKTPRQINRNLVFNLVRSCQPLSRADLARTSGLQRSTISLIVEELVSDGWILEGSIGTYPGRGSPTSLELNRNRVVIALDIQPSQATVAVTDFGGRIIAGNVIMRPTDPNEAVQHLIAAILKLIAAHSERSFDGVGISLPGRTDPLYENLVFPPNSNCPVFGIKSSIREATGLHVEMDNVANACALSEVWFGDSNAGHDIVVVNVSNVIETGIFANGRVLHGSRGMAGEFGHVQIDPYGPLCNCGKQGCWQSVASNLAGLRYYKEISGDIGPHSPQNFASLVKMAQARNPNAIRALEKMSSYLGQGLRVIASALAPNEIVIVGEVTTAWHMIVPNIEAALKENSLSTVPKLRPSVDASVAYLRSAVALVMNGKSI